MLIFSISDHSLCRPEYHHRFELHVRGVTNTWIVRNWFGSQLNSRLRKLWKTVFQPKHDANTYCFHLSIYYSSKYIKLECLTQHDESFSQDQGDICWDESEDLLSSLELWIEMVQVATACETVTINKSKTQHHLIVQSQ